VWVLWLTGAVSSPRPEWYAYFHIQNFTVAAIINALALRYFLARHQLRQRTLSEARAKIEVLRSRIRPHFLFNTMNIIASLIRSAPDKAETAVVDMADLFRTMLGDSENLVPVSNEIAIAKKYLDIEALRLDNRLHVDGMSASAQGGDAGTGSASRCWKTPSSMASSRSRPAA
jgi:two-component system sensor histidine kinase AlgZ